MTDAQNANPSGAQREATQDLLDGLRWRADQIITNYFGERIWLRQIEGGITDCCLADEPCDYHAGFTHPAGPQNH
jgi:hypothetical protein